MKRRDIVQEIVARRSRNAEGNRLAAFGSRYDSIAAAFKRQLELANPDEGAIDPELCRYFPIALVAAIEGYFRQCVADLVNIGPPFLDRAAKLKDTSLSVVAAGAIQKQSITLGEYVAHFISISSLEDINRVLSMLLDMDFLETLLTSDFDVFDEDEPLHFREGREDIVSAALYLFQTRHLLCHEFASDTRPDISEILRMITVTDVLVGLSEIVVCAEENYVAG